MRVRQVLDIQPARSIANEDPLPGRSFASGSSNKLLIDKAWFDGSKVPNVAAEYYYFRSNFKLPLPTFDQ